MNLVFFPYFTSFCLALINCHSPFPVFWKLKIALIRSFGLQVFQCSQAITKPQAKSNEAALKEIEEAMKKVKEAQSLVNSAVDPLMSVLGVKGKASRSRSRSPTSRTRDYYR